MVNTSGSITTSLSTLQLNPYEYCEILEKNNLTQVKVIKLMPLMGTGKPKDLPFSIPQKITCNAKDCEPNVSKKCRTKNYMTIKAFSTASGPVEPGDRKIVSIVNGDIREIYITGE